MVVSFTPNIGLAKPSESELAEDWANGPQLADDNNTLIETFTNVVMSNYSPTFIALTTNPNVGAGVLAGDFCQIGGFIFGTFTIRCADPGIGSGTGVGAYGISLPGLADTTFHTVGTGLADAPGVLSCIGDGYMSDGSSVGNSGTVALDIIHIAGVPYARPITEFYAGKTNRWFGPTIPFSLADTDTLTGVFFYKAA